MADTPELELDIARIVVRLEQIDRLPANSGLRELLWRRVLLSDVPRLRRYLSPATEALLREGAPEESATG